MVQAEPIASVAWEGQQRHPGAPAAVFLRDVTVHYGGAEGLLAVDGVSCAVAPGEFVSIVGPSGCGKTSLLRVVGGLLEPSHGAVAVLGEAVQEAQRRKRIGFVFQEPALLPWRTVEANVRLPLQVNARAGREPGQVKELLRLVGLESFRDYRPHELSGGMQQRVALARALVFRPDVLLMDEPFGALDEITREQMRYELLRIWSATNAQEGGGRRTVVFVTHSVTEAVALSDRVLVMSRRPGRIKAAIDIDLPRPRSQVDERSAEFLDHVDLIRAQLREELTP
ncbi:MAG: ABC transporter ATP-binding protein [Dehalococcoidia bacterium]